MSNQEIYQAVTDSIIAAIEAGQTAEKFQLPWSGFSAIPMNAQTKNSYRGVNIPILWASQLQAGFASGYWGTYKQWQERGAQVKKGAKGTKIVFWKEIEIEPHGDNEESESRMFARWSVVFNADQVEGFEIPMPNKAKGTAEILDEAESFIQATGAKIHYSGTRAYYDHKADAITLPERALFRDTQTRTATEGFYSTALHELTHWSGAPQRLNREKGKAYGDSAYAFEELVAELGAAMLCASLGITGSTRADHAQYIDGWLKALKSDKKFIFAAASQAQKSADYLKSLQPQTEAAA